MTDSHPDEIDQRETIQLIFVLSMLSALAIYRSRTEDEKFLSKIEDNFFHRKAGVLASAYFEEDVAEASLAVNFIEDIRRFMPDKLEKTVADLQEFFLSKSLAMTEQKDPPRILYDYFRSILQKLYPRKLAGMARLKCEIENKDIKSDIIGTIIERNEDGTYIFAFFDEKLSNIVEINVHSSNLEPLEL